MATPLPSDDLGGRLLGGRYRVRTLRGRGGMGAVWVAYDENGNKEIAIKVVRAALLEDPQAMGRFKREAKVIRGLDHPSIVRSLDAGEDEGLLWIAMELLEGETLRQRMDTRGRMSWEESLSTARAILGALQAAHDAGVIHRDLKPDNVMLMSDGKIKLLDFGVAKQSHLESNSVVSSMTGTGFIVGTPGYVAPEVVLEGKNDDPRSDLYAFGVVWFEMLTGQKPFTAKTPFALAMKHAHEPAPRASTLLPFSPIPLAVENLVAQLMAKSPDERPPSAGVVLDLIDAIERGAAAALTGTPQPGAMDYTETDIRDTPQGTAVVPMKLTPSTPGLALSPSSPTPATGMASPTASPLPGLLKALPVKHRALLGLLSMFSVLGVIAALAVVVFAVKGGPADRPEEGASEAALPAPSVVQAVPLSSSPSSEIVPATPSEDRSSEEIAPPPEPEPTAQAEKREGRLGKEKPKPRDERRPPPAANNPAIKPPSTPPSNPPSHPPTQATVRIRVSPPTTVSIDGGSPSTSPRTANVSPGAHTLSFGDGRKPITINVGAGDCVGFNVDVKDGEAVLKAGSPFPLVECPR